MRPYTLAAVVAALLLLAAGPAVAQYRIIDIDTQLGAGSYEVSNGFGINNGNQVVGHVRTWPGAEGGFMWEGGVKTRLGEQEDRPLVRPYAINDSGFAAGYCEGLGGSGYFTRATVWDTTVRDGNDVVPAINLGFGQTSGGGSEAYAINASGQVVGHWHKEGSNYQGFLITPRDDNQDGRPDVWYEDVNTDGVNDLMTNLAPAGASFSLANDINDSGLIVGRYLDASTMGYAALWLDENTVVNLGVNPGAATDASAINSGGCVAGGYDVYGNGATSQAFRICPADTNEDGEGDLWFEDGNQDGINDLMEALGDLGGNYSEVNDINDMGIIVGSSHVAGGDSHAFAWLDEPALGLPAETMIDLNDLIGPGDPYADWVLVSAVAINEEGWIVGGMTNPTTGEHHGFLLVPEPGMFSLLALGGLALVRRRRR